MKKIWTVFESTLRRLIDLVMKPSGKRLTDPQWSAFMQFIKFGLVGAMNTVVDYGTYLATLYIFVHLHWFGEKAYLVSTMLGFIVSFFNMFFWNNKYVFKKGEDEQRSALASLIKLFITYSLTGIIIRPGCMFVLVDLIGVPQTIAPIPVLLITIPANFILSKLWAFKSKKKTGR